MSLLVFCVILFSAALHAVWNAIVKGGSDTLLTTVLVAASGALVGLVSLPFLPPIAPAAWSYLGISAVLEIAYYGLVAAAYRNADMSRAYPLMRGTPPLLVALVSSLLLGAAVSLTGWLGVALISAGLLSLTLGSTKSDSRGVTFAMVNALVIASYTLVDSFGVRASGSPATYTMWIFVLTGVPLAAWALLRRADFLPYARSNWHLGLAGGFGTLISYGLVLWSMTMAPVALVAALRETSILFGTIIAVLVLKEKVTRTRLVAVLIIAAGAAVLKLA
jgi:drug/metabolite transporter (DMT)-like permease